MYTVYYTTRSGPGCSNPVRSSRELASSLKGGKSQLPAPEAESLPEHCLQDKGHVQQNITRFSKRHIYLMKVFPLVKEISAFDVEGDENEG